MPSPERRKRCCCLRKTGLSIGQQRYSCPGRWYLKAKPWLRKEGLAVQGSSAISMLPRYLTAQMVRFFYKVDTQQKAKILRKVIPVHCN